MGLLDLPGEILDAIIDLTLPAGFEAFVLSCKTVHGRAATQLQRHNALRRQWQHTTNANWPRRSDTLQILHAISCDPLVALYIEHLSLWDRRSLDSSQAVAQLDFRADPDAMGRIRNMVTASKYLVHANVDADEWWDKVLEEDRQSQDDGDGDSDSLHAAASLLSCLPNLKTLTLSPSWKQFGLRETSEFPYKDVTFVIESIVECTRVRRGCDEALGKLETIFPFMAEGYEERAALQSLHDFLPLASLTEVNAISCLAVDDHYTGIPFQWRSLMQSHIRRLELAYCCIDSDGIASVTAHLPCLQVFKYSHQTKWHGCQHDWNPGSFIEAGLAQNCGQTITELAITIDELYGDIENGASSLHSFPNLMYLEVDLEVFCGPPIESGHRLGQNAVVPKNERMWTREDIPCIGDMLPESIREIQVNTDFQHTDGTALVSLFKNIVEHRSSRLVHTRGLRRRRRRRRVINCYASVNDAGLEA